MEYLCIFSLYSIVKVRNLGHRYCCWKELNHTIWRGHDANAICISLLPCLGAALHGMAIGDLQ